MNHIILRKEVLSPKNKSYFFKSIVRAFFFAPLRAVLTVEAAVVLSLFLFCMISVIQYGRAMEASVKLGSALADAGKTLAAAAYLKEYPTDIQATENADLAVSMLSAAWAQGSVLKAAGDTSAIRNANMLLSSILEEEEKIDLVLTYQIRAPLQSVPLPGTFFLQRACVRAWTGRKENDNGESDGEDTDSHTVYVTATGSVYHRDLECTYLKLSIHEVDKAELDRLRNRSGAIYYPCEKCGKHAGGQVYITNDGNRYHTSLECSSLKRTIQEIPEEEAADRKACSKCGGA